MVEANVEDVKRFLKEFKKIVVSGRGLDVIPRRENIGALAQLGLNKKNRKEEILGLSVADYSEGPKPDKGRPGYIWVFGKEIGGNEVYIKLKIADAEGGKIAKCISFHSADFPLSYPHRASERGDEK